MSEADNQGGEQDGGDVDLSFVPETFRTEDGKPDVGAFRAAFDEMAAARAVAEEAAAAYPKTPDDFPFTVPEDLSDLLPEGMELPEDFALALTDDPDLPALKALLHEHKASPAVAEGLAKMLAQRELRDLHQASTEHRAEMAKLGANAQSRIDTAKRALSARLPAAEAEALIGSVTTADGIRAVEKLLSASGQRPSTTTNGQTADLESMTPRQKIEYGYAQRAQARS